MKSVRAVEAGCPGPGADDAVADGGAADDEADEDGTDDDVPDAPGVTPSGTELPTPFAGPAGLLPPDEHAARLPARASAATAADSRARETIT